jgi:hypothetical protein
MLEPNNEYDHEAALALKVAAGKDAFFEIKPVKRIKEMN